jgi:hypothetical protein
MNRRSPSNALLSGFAVDLTFGKLSQLAVRFFPASVCSRRMPSIAAQIVPFRPLFSIRKMLSSRLPGPRSREVTFES